MLKIYNWVRLLPFLLILDISAQGSNAVPKEKESAKKTLTARFIALGHRRTAKFTRTKKAEVIKVTTPEGETFEEIIPAGTPIEVKGERFEYLPSRVYIPNKNNETDSQYLLRPLILNACSPEIALKPRQNLSVYIRKHLTQENKKTELSKYFSTPIAKKQTHIVTAIVKRHTSINAWENPIIKSFDTSYHALPPQSLLIFNGTPLNIEIQVPHQSGVKKITIPPLASHQLQPSVNQRGETIVIANLAYPNGARRQFYYNSLNIAKDGRAYLFAYCDPRKNASNPAGTVQFYDTISPPEKK